MPQRTGWTIVSSFAQGTIYADRVEEDYRTTCTYRREAGRIQIIGKGVRTEYPTSVLSLQSYTNVFLKACRHHKYH